MELFVVLFHLFSDEFAVAVCTEAIVGKFVEMASAHFMRFNAINMKEYKVVIPFKAIIKMLGNG